MSDDLHRLTARAAVARLRAGDLTPFDLIDAAEHRAAAVNPAINALVTPCFDRSRRHARRLMTRPPSQRGSLCGLPIAVKDLTDVADVRTTYGSPLFAEFVPTTSDAIVDTLEAHGAIVVGKTNTPEFGAGGNTFNAVFGATRNPWNPALNAGGSSGGSAATLAVGIVSLATGSDLGGSLRTPASYCSVVGLRPSPGRLAGTAADPRLAGLGLDGPMARNVADVALMLDAMAGPATPDPEGAFLRAALRPSRPRRVALAVDLGGATPVDPATRAIVERTAAALAAAGVDVVLASPDFRGAMDAFYTLRALGYAADLGDLLCHRDMLKPEVAWNIEQGLALTTAAIEQAQLRRARLRVEVEQFLQHYDLLLAPSACCPPGPLSERWVREVDGHVFSDYVGWLTLHGVLTLTGCPSLAIPAGFTVDGRPVGVQLVGRPDGEAALLSAGAAIEALLGLADRVPIDPVSPDANGHGGTEEAPE